MASGKFHGEMHDDGAARFGARFGMLGLGGIVAQEIHRLAHFRHAVGQGLAGLARRQREELDGIGLVEIGGIAQDRGALGDGPPRPGRLRLDRDPDRLRDLLGCRFDDRADNVRRLRRIDDRPLLAAA